MIKLNQNIQPGIFKGNPSSGSNTRVFLDGSTRSFSTLRTATIGFGTYQPGWRWSLHAQPQTGKNAENHIGYIISGCMMVKDPLGNEAQIESGCAFEIAPGSDAWVIGDDPCIALDFISISEHS
jgi:hypothetical protein